MKSPLAEDWVKLPKSTRVIVLYQICQLNRGQFCFKSRSCSGEEVHMKLPCLEYSSGKKCPQMSVLYPHVIYHTDPESLKKLQQFGIWPLWTAQGHLNPAQRAGPAMSTPAGAGRGFQPFFKLMAVTLISTREIPCAEQGTPSQETLLPSDGQLGQVSLSATAKPSFQHCLSIRGPPFWGRDEEFNTSQCIYSSPEQGCQKSMSCQQQL